MNFGPVSRRALTTLAAFGVAAMAALSVLLASAELRQGLSLFLHRHWFEWRPASVVLCGDSNVAALTPALIRQTWGWGQAANLARPGARTRHALAQLDQALRLRARHVVVAVGTNDLASPDDIVLADFETLLRVPSRPAGTALVLLPIPLQARADLDERIHTLNRSLQLAAQRHGWRFVDTNRVVFRSEMPRAAALEDAVHLSPAARQVWLRTLAQALDGSGPAIP